MLDLSAVHRPVLEFSGTVHGNFGSQYTLPSVSRSAGLLSLNLVDSVYSALFPQMDVWPRCNYGGLVKGPRTVGNTNYPPARRTYSAESRGISVSP
jgi:hypothetical protein